MKTATIKREIIRYTAALAALLNGSRNMGIDALQLGELPDEKILMGLTARLGAQVQYAKATNRRISRADLSLAEAVLARAKASNSQTVIFSFEVTLDSPGHAQLFTTKALPHLAKFVIDLPKAFPDDTFEVRLQEAKIKV